jgi:hypothetical protein
VVGVGVALEVVGDGLADVFAAVGLGDAAGG